MRKLFTKTLVNIATKLSSIAIILSLGLVLTASFGSANTVHAQSDFCGTLSSDFQGFIDCDQGFTSFTQFEGGLQPVDEEGFDPGLTRAGDARTFVKNVVNFALSFLGLIAVVITIYGGFLYVTAAGNEEQGNKGKQAIVYAIIGILIILGSFAIVNTVIRAPGDIGSDGTTTGGSGGQSNTRQLANYNSASEQAKSVTAEFVRSYEDYFNQSVLIQKMMRYEVDKLTNRQEFINYLVAIRENLIELERRNIATGRGELALRSAAINNTSLAARVIIDGVIDPAIRVLNDIIDDERTEAELARVYNTFLGDVVDSAKEAWSDVKEGAQSLFTYEDGKDEEDINCLLPPELRTVEGEFDCKGIRKTTADNFGSSVVARMDLFLEDVLIKQGINVDYNERLDDITDRVTDIQESLLNFGTVQTTTEVEAAFNKVFDLLNQVRAEDIAYQINLSRDEVTSTDLSASDVFNRTAAVRELIVAFSELHDVLNEIRFVAAFIRANNVKGNAPLVVQFDASESFDPADQSLTDDNFEWDLDGDGNFGSIGSQNLGRVKDCREENATIVSCTYKTPGSYRVALRAKSNQPTQIAPGISYITINVQEPVAKIDLRTIVNNEEEVIRSYNDSGFIERDVDEIRVTLNDASAGEGIVFDARGTAQNSQGTRIVRYSWNFGDGTALLTGSEQEAGRVSHVFSTNGTYRVVIEVEDEAGNKDRKIVNVVVTSLAANLKANQLTGDLSTQFTFDAGRSRSDGGEITQFNWSIEGISDIESVNAPTFEHRFEQPGNYVVTVQVQDSAGNIDTASVEVLVESQTPKPFFAIEFLPNQPSTVLLDASDTYDPDEGDILSYQWTVFNAREGTDFDVLEGQLSGNEQSASKLKLKFKNQRNYVVELRVADQYEDDRLRKEASVQADINIQTLVDLALGDDHQQAAIVEDGSAEVTLHFVSEFARAIEVDFGDGSNPEPGAFTNGEFKVKHIYQESGLYQVTATAIGDEGDENSLKSTLVVGRGDSIIPVVEIEYNGISYQLDDALPIVSRGEAVRFNAAKSLNSDGSSTGLNYSWNFGDGRFGDGASVSHAFRDLAPTPPGYFEISVQVTNDQGKQEQANFNLRVESVPPVIQGIQITPLNPNDKSAVAIDDNLVTPFPVRVEAQGVTDADGTIDEYRFYYFPVLDPGRKLGVKITKDPVAEVEVDTLGIEGDRNEFAFCVDIADNEGNEVICTERFADDELPKLTASNGRNDAPIASFVVDRTNVFVGEEINFSSTSDDPDGEIVSYQWDIDGDGSFANDAPQQESALIHSYNRRSEDKGFRVRLKVVDDKGATAVSEPVTIFVDSVLDPPTAAFTSEQGGNGETRFINNSRADSAKGGEIARYIWDFDTGRDSDGDGNGQNDTDATDEAPTHNYADPGTYQVKLTVVDNEGNFDEVTNNVTATQFVGSPTVSNPDPVPSNSVQAVLRSNPPRDQLTNTIYLTDTNRSVSFNFDESIGEIERFQIDRDIYFDTNGGQPGTPGDGIRNNDVDFETINVNETYTAEFLSDWEPIEVQLTVIDAAGNVSRDSVRITFDQPGFGQASLQLDRDGILTILAIIGGISVLLYIGTSLVFRPKSKKLKRKLR